MPQGDLLFNFSDEGSLILRMFGRRQASKHIASLKQNPGRNARMKTVLIVNVMFA